MDVPKNGRADGRTLRLLGLSLSLKAYRVCQVQGDPAGSLPSPLGGPRDQVPGMAPRALSHDRECICTKWLTDWLF